MKLIQLNIWQGILMYQAARFLKEERPDILNLQEVTTGVGDSDSYLFSVLEKLKRDFPQLRNRYFQHSLSSRYFGKKVYLGNMILSRYRISGKKSVFTEGKPEENVLLGKESHGVCFLQHTRMETPAGVVNDLNYHGYWVPTGKTGNATTLRHCRMIADYIESIDKDEKIILTGDFNLSPHSRSMEILNKRLTNLIIKHGIKTTRPPIRDTRTPVDFILVNGKVRVRSFRVPMNAIASDHLPLILNFD